MWASLCIADVFRMRFSSSSSTRRKRESFHSLAANKVLHCRLRAAYKNQYSVYACNDLQRCQAWNSLSGVFNLVTNWLLTLVERTGTEKLLRYDSFTVSYSSNANKMSAVFFLKLSHRFRLQFGVHASFAATERPERCGWYDGELWTVRSILDRKKILLSSLSKQRNCVWAIFHHLPSSFFSFLLCRAIRWSSSLHSCRRLSQMHLIASNSFFFLFFSHRHNKSRNFSQLHACEHGETAQEWRRNVATRNNCQHLISERTRERSVKANWWGCYWNLLLLSKSKSL